MLVNPPLPTSVKHRGLAPLQHTSWSQHLAPAWPAIVSCLSLSAGLHGSLAMKRGGRTFIAARAASQCRSFSRTAHQGVASPEDSNRPRPSPPRSLPTLRRRAWTRFKDLLGWGDSYWDAVYAQAKGLKNSAGETWDEAVSGAQKTWEVRLRAQEKDKGGLLGMVVQAWQGGSRSGDGTTPAQGLGRARL